MTQAQNSLPDFGQIDAELPSWPAKRPVRIAVLGDFGAGALRGRLDTGAELARRKPVRVEFDTLEDALRRFGTELSLPLGAEHLPVPIELADLESFHPDELYRNVEVFSALASLRKRLNTPASFAKAAEEVRGWGQSKLRRASRVARGQRARGATPADARDGDFARLLGKQAAPASEAGAVDQLLRNIVGPFVQPSASPDRDLLLRAVDDALGDAMRALLHQPDFQNLESLWRGADFLLRRLETDSQLQVHLIDVSADELSADLDGVQDLSESGLYKLLVKLPSEHADGGYTYLVSCHRFAPKLAHIRLLGRLAKLAAHAGAPWLTGIETDDFTDRKEPPGPRIRAAWDALRALPEASHLALFGPRFLLRHMYGRKTDPVSSFDFEEFHRADGLRGMLWGHPALLAASVLCLRGATPNVGDLPYHTYVDEDGDSVALPCTDRLIGTGPSALLRDYGINALMAHKGQPMVHLSGLQALDGAELAAAAGETKRPAASRVAIGSASAAGKSAVGAVSRAAAAPADSGGDESVAEEGGTDEAGSDDLGLGDLGDFGDLGTDDSSSDASADETSSTEDDASSDDAGLDPELQALLDSL